MKYVFALILGLTMTDFATAQISGGGISGGGSAAPSGAAGGDLTGTYPNPTISLSITPTWAGLHTFNAGLISTNLASTGTITSPSTNGTVDHNSWVTCCVNVTGTQTFVNTYAPLNWNWNYSLNALSSTNGDAGEQHEIHMRNGFAGKFILSAHSLYLDEAPLAIDTSPHAYYVLGPFLDITPNVGGTALNAADALGINEPFFCDAILEAAATNIAQVTPCEVDTNLKAGSSAVTVDGVLNVLGSATLNRGATSDAAMSFIGTQVNAGIAGWKTGIGFGGPVGTSPFLSDSTYIKAWRRQLPSLDSAPVADAGLDLESTTFTNYFTRSQGFAVGPLGNTNANNLTLSGGAITVATAGIASIAAVADNKSITGGLYYGSASLPTLVIQASPGGGTQAAATVATMKLGEADILTTGTGVADGDTLTMAGPTGTQPTLTAHVGTFTGSITKNVLTVTGSVTGSAIAVGQILTGAGISTVVYITSGSGTSWKINVGFSATISAEAMTVTGVTIASVGSLTALTAAPTTTGGSASVQPTFNFGFSIATITVGTAGTLYSVLPPPMVWPSNGSSSRNTPAVLAATMSAATQAPLTINSTSVKLPGSSSGTVTIATQAAAGTYELDLPTTAGTAGQVLTSQGGASVPMTWTSGPVNLFGWGLPVGIAPSGYFQDNGVYIVGQAPTSSATVTFGATSGSTSMTFSVAPPFANSAADVGRVLTVLDTVSVTATNASPAVFTGDTLPNGTIVNIGGTPPTGFSTGTNYYVVATSGNTFQLSATSGGSAINSSSTGTSVTAASYKFGTCTANVSTSQCTATISGGTLSNPTTIANNIIWLSGSPTATSSFSVPLPQVFSPAYMYFGSGVICATCVSGGVNAAGPFYAICRTTTVCDIYGGNAGLQTPLASGRPVTIGNPTAFVGTGAHVFAQTTSPVTLLTLSIPGNSMGTQGSLVLDTYGTRNNNSDTVVFSSLYGGTSFAQVSAASVLWYGLHRTLREAGTTSSQVFLAVGGNIASDLATNTGAATYMAIDETSSQNLLIRTTLSTTGLDWFFNLGGTVTANSSP